MNRHKRGKLAEAQALSYLQKQGLKLVTTNFVAPMGEIDLIMRDKEQLVFVEVRYRSQSDYGGAAASINHSKKVKLTKTAHFYLNRHHGDSLPVCRFDVLLFDGEHLDWQRNVDMV